MTTPNNRGIPYINFSLTSLQAILFAALIGCAFTLIFGRLTAGSNFGFPLFILAVLVLIYFPGKCIIDLTDVRVSPLEDATLSLVTGMTVTSMIYWLLSLISLNGIFFLWPTASVAMYVYNRRKKWNGFGKAPIRIDTSHLLLFILIVASLIPLLLLPFYYTNMVLNENNAMLISTGPNDLFFHMAISQELTHAIPPQSPVFSGKALNYHCWPDLLATIFINTFRLGIEDLSVRFIPTFLLTLAILSSFIFNRRWLKSRYAALLSTLLVFFGENLAYFFGLFYKSTPLWSFDYFRAPTTFNLYLFNTMLPALIILFAGLFCFFQYHTEKSKNWLILTAFLFAVLIEYKIFMSLHVLLSLSITGGLYYLLFKDLRLMKLSILTAILLTLPFLQAYMGNRESSILWVRFDPQLYITNVPMLFSEALTNPAIVFLKGELFTFCGVASLLLFVLPIYLIGSFGIGIFSIPVIIKNLFFPKQENAMKFFMALFIVTGPLISLNSNLTPRDYPDIFNNMVWFLIHSKHLAWILSVEFFWNRIKHCQPYTRRIVIVIIILLSVPSAVQSLNYLFNQQQKFRIGPSGTALLQYLKGHSLQGEVMIAPPQSSITAPIVTMTKLRTPYLNLFLRSYGGRREELEKRKKDISIFWSAWANRKVGANFIHNYSINYIVIKKHSKYFQPGFPGVLDSKEKNMLKLFYQNDKYIVYRAVK